VVVLTSKLRYLWYGVITDWCLPAVKCARYEKSPLVVVSTGSTTTTSSATAGSATGEHYLKIDFREQQQICNPLVANIRWRNLNPLAGR